MDKYLTYSNYHLVEEIKKSDDALRNHLIRLLLNRKDSDSYVKNLLTKEKPEIRNAVLRLMPSSKVSSLLPVLVQLFDQEVLKNRRIIVDKLSGIKDPLAINSLLNCINQDEDSLLKKKAIAALGNMEDETVVDQLIKHFEQADNDAKINILIVFSKIGSPKAIPVLRESLYNQDAVIRYWAIKAMKAFSQHIDFEEVIQLVRTEKNFDNKVNAIHLLSRFNRPEVLDFLVLQLLENNQPSLKYDILKSFKNFEPDKVRSILYKKSKEALTPHTNKVIYEALDFLKSVKPIDLTNARLIYRTWIRNPLSYPDSSEISFYQDGKGIYKEIKAGEIELRRFFRFIIKNENIIFLPESGQGKSTKFKIQEGILNLPYERGVPCFILKYSNQNIYINGINITGSSYYFLKEN